jgi:hypothetical protein
MVFDGEKGLCRLSARNVKKHVLYFRTINLMEEVLGNTLIDRKSRMPQIQGIKGDAVVIYCEPLITKKMGYHRLS